MENTDAAVALFKYVQDQYPIECLSKKVMRVQSAKRWAINELASRVLDHPYERPIDILTEFIGELTCMIFNMKAQQIRSDRIQPYYEAWIALLNVESYFNEV